MSDTFTPTAIANIALDRAAVNFTLGDIQSGVREAQVCLRAYSDCLRQMLRTAGWNFARKDAPLLLLADATGQTPNVGSIVPGGQFIYEYAMPVDAAKLRYIPWCPFLNPGTPPNNIVPADASAPLLTNLGQPPYVGRRVVPARFLVTSDQNYIPPGASNDIQGITPLGRTVILTNVQNARGIYTYDAMFPNAWDIHFREAMVAALAAMIALPLATDKKFGMQMRAQNIEIAKEKIKDARVSDGQEGWHSSDVAVDWMRFRNSGGYGWNGSSWWSGVGDWNCAYDSFSFGGNGSAY